MQMYAVKLNEGHKARPDQQFEGWLGEEEICLYTRGEAIKKARQFGGSIKPYGKKFTVKSLTVLQLSKKEIDDVIVRQLEVFEENKITGGKLPDVLEQELTVLNNICINADYIMLVD